MTGLWTCVGCGTANHGAFCVVCGTPSTGPAAPSSGSGRPSSGRPGQPSQPGQQGQSGHSWPAGPAQGPPGSTANQVGIGAASLGSGPGSNAAGQPLLPGHGGGQQPPLVASVERIPAYRPGADAGVPAPRATTSTVEERPDRRRLWAAVAAVALVLAAALAGAVLAANRGGGEDRDAAPTPTVDQIERTTAVDPPVAVSTSTSPAAVDTTSPPTSAATPSTIDTAPPPTAPPSSAPPRSSVVYPTSVVLDDPTHLVSIWLPDVMSEVAVESEFRLWAYEDVTFEWIVYGPASIATADSLRDELLGRMVTVTTNTKGSAYSVDGSSIVSGTTSDGTVIYSRQKIRCGDLVEYRITVDPHPTASSRAIGGQIPNDLYSLSAEGDAMGGVHATC